MEQTVTTIEELMPHLNAGMSARELGAVLILLVPQDLKFKLACEARHRLGKTWSDKTVRDWLKPATHSAQQKERALASARRWKANNKDRHSELKARWRRENDTRNREYKTRWHAENAEHCRERKRQWSAENADHVRYRSRAYYRQRLATDIDFRLVHYLRTRVRDVLRGRSKLEATLHLIGCSVEHLRAHLEAQFLPGMTWDNYGDWHLDHIRPCASFDLTDPEQQRECFRWSNLQPMWASENCSKGSLYQGVRHRHGSRSGARAEATRSGA